MRRRPPLRALAVLAGALSISVQGATLTVRLDQPLQEIEGFGASDAWSIDPAVKRWIKTGRADKVEELADLLFSSERGIGLSAWRFNIGAGSAEQGESSRIPDPYRRAELLVPAPGASVDTSKQAGQVRFLQEARERGVETFVAFVNSPPVWATKNGLAHSGTGEGIGSTNLHPERVDSFSEFLVQVVSYLRSDAIGVPVNYLSPVNEPTWHWEGESQEGNRASNVDLKRIYHSLFLALERAGLDDAVEIDAAEIPEYRAALSDDLHTAMFGGRFIAGMSEADNGEFRNYVDALLGDEALRRIIGNKLSLHAYYTDADAERLGRLRDLLRENVERVSPDARLWMSEYCVLGDTGDVRTFLGPGFDPGDMTVGLHVARIIHRDLTRLNVTAWFWWLALTPYDYKDGLVRADADLSPDSLQPSKILWALGQYSRFIRPGYRRVAAPGLDDLHGLMATAYLSPDKRELVVVVVNAGGQDESLALAIDGWNETASGIQLRGFVTDAGRNLAPLDESLQLDVLPIAAGGVSTFVVSRN